MNIKCIDSWLFCMYSKQPLWFANYNSFLYNRVIRTVLFWIEAFVRPIEIAKRAAIIVIDAHWY